MSIDYSRCVDEVRGPTFCAVRGGQQVTGMPSDRGNWCEVGAATRVAKYRDDGVRILVSNQ